MRLKWFLWHIAPLRMTMPTLEVLGVAATQVFSYWSDDTAVGK